MNSSLNPRKPRGTFVVQNEKKSKSRSLGILTIRIAEAKSLVDEVARCERECEELTKRRSNEQHLGGKP